LLQKATDRRDASESEKAYQRIRDLVLLHRLRPGEKTSLARLCEEVKLGRTPVAEAVARLASEGLFNVSERRGTYVNELRPEEIDDLFSLRRLLEGFAAERAAKRITSEDLEAMAKLLSEMERESRNEQIDLRSRARFIDKDVEFHGIIVRAARSPHLSRVYSSLNLHLLIATYLGVSSGPERAASRHREHLRILNALRAGDASELKAALHAHADHVEEGIRRALGLPSKNGRRRRVAATGR
jgi:DNA-binding GntR family transcriptional regulator